MNVFFEKVVSQFKKPWSSFLEIASREIDSYSNRVVIGKYLPNEKAPIKAFSIIGIAPDSNDPESQNLDGLFLECNMFFGNEIEKKIWLLQLREATNSLSIFPELSQINSVFLREMVQEALGKRKFHLIGMLSVHHTIKSKETFSVLWGHPQLREEFIEHVIKMVAGQRLR